MCVSNRWQNIYIGCCWAVSAAFVGAIWIRIQHNFILSTLCISLFFSLFWSRSWSLCFVETTLSSISCINTISVLYVHCAMWNVKCALVKITSSTDGCGVHFVCHLLLATFTVVGQYSFILSISFVCILHTIWPKCGHSFVIVAIRFGNSHWQQTKN